MGVRASEYAKVKHVENMLNMFRLFYKGYTRVNYSDQKWSEFTYALIIIIMTSTSVTVVIHNELNRLCL